MEVRSKRFSNLSMGADRGMISPVMSIAIRAECSAVTARAGMMLMYVAIQQILQLSLSQEFLFGKPMMAELPGAMPDLHIKVESIPTSMLQHFQNPVPIL